VFRSLLAMHFRHIVLSHWPVEISMRRSEGGLGTVSPARAIHTLSFLRLMLRGPYLDLPPLMFKRIEKDFVSILATNFVRIDTKMITV
jgi:hypothetical protein